MKIFLPLQLYQMTLIINMFFLGSLKELEKEEMYYLQFQHQVKVRIF